MGQWTFFAAFFLAITSKCHLPDLNRSEKKIIFNENILNEVSV
jgi:hypothetical protein